MYALYLRWAVPMAVPRAGLDAGGARGARAGGAGARGPWAGRAAAARACGWHGGV